VVIETQVEGTVIPEAVAIKGIVPEADLLGGATSGLEDPIAPDITEEVHDDTLPDSSIVVRSPEIQDAEPIRSAPMSETVTTSGGILETLRRVAIQAGWSFSPSTTTRYKKCRRKATT
jgi:hypothetical protein